MNSMNALRTISGVAIFVSSVSCSPRAAMPKINDVAGQGTHGYKMTVWNLAQVAQITTGANGESASVALSGTIVDRATGLLRMQDSNATLCYVTIIGQPPTQGFVIDGIPTDSVAVENNRNVHIQTIADVTNTAMQSFEVICKRYDNPVSASVVKSSLEGTLLVAPY